MDSMEGQWWLPESPDRRIFGRVALGEESSWTLSLEGSLQAEDSLRGPRPDAEQARVIHGRTRDELVSLFDCVRQQIWTRNMSLDRESWRFESVVEGTDHLSPEDRMEEIHVRLGALLEWAEHRRPSVAAHEGVVTLTTDTEESTAAQIDGGTISLVLGFATAFDETAVRVEPDAMFRCLPTEGITFEDAATAYVSPLRDLVCFLSLDYVDVEIGGRTTTTDDHSPAFRFRRPLQRPYHRPEPKRTPEMLASRSSLGLELQVLVEAWFDLWARQRDAIRMLLQHHHAPYLHANTKLLTAFLAMEHYHEVAIGGRAVDPDEHKLRVNAVLDKNASADDRRWAHQILSSSNQKGAKRRLREVIDRAGRTGFLLVQTLPGFVQLAVDSRHQVAHPSSTEAQRGLSFLAAAIGLRWLLRHCLLDDLFADLDLPDDAAAQVMSDCYALKNDLRLLDLWSERLA